VIEYPPRQAAAAALVHQVLRGAATRAVAGLVRIRIVLGTAGYTVSGAAPATTGSQPVVPAQAHTAAQDACR
jgi:hypothetical protein